MCIQDCLHDPGKGLSQDQSFRLNLTPRSKSQCLMFLGPENIVHSCVLFGILSVVHPCSCLKSVFSVHVLSAPCVQRLSEETALGCLARRDRNVETWASPLIAKALWVIRAQGIWFVVVLTSKLLGLLLAGYHSFVFIVSSPALFWE